MRKYNEKSITSFREKFSPVSYVHYYFSLIIINLCFAVFSIFLNAVDVGPDAFGYIATDNLNPLAPDAPAFLPDDITAIGNPVDGLEDDNCVEVVLPFNFVFYG
ncbi:MAG: hypothetical protein ACK4NF_06930, partial [Planctomycetota bacterium]